MATLIKHELASVFARGLRDPRIGFVTVTDVQVSDDLKHARVFYSVLGTEEKKAETAEGLEQARGFLQRDLAHNLKLRFTPRLSFCQDASLEEGMKIDGIIKKIHEEQ
ncbi:MAG: 30S ribosome-binding factor RbfA [Candidatus Omnitrophica bacterium]|nr:30S ribosome-binding factor RbfA [Candidatus Omnitrophota bacterium]